MSGAAVERYRVYADDDLLPPGPLFAGQIEVVKASAHDAAIAALTAELQQCRPQWQPIETAPKDGTPVFIWREGWDSAPIASWGEYPANPVMDSNEENVWMEGWLIEDCVFCGGHEEGFLGWNEDPMPTHWMPKPGPQEVAIKERT